jgi:hypothetical protein
MCTTIPLTGLSPTHRLESPEFSISPCHALALSNIYTPISKTLFISKPSEWKTSPLSPQSCKENGKRHYQRPQYPHWRGEKSINMGKNYTRDPRGLLPGKKIEPKGLQEMPFQDPHTFPRLLVKNTEYRDGAIYPQFGDFRIDMYIRGREPGVPIGPYIKGNAHRKPIKGAGLVQEMRYILCNPHITKDGFPAPFCELPDDLFRAWFVQNMGLVGWGVCEAEREVERVLKRTGDKEKEKEGLDEDAVSLEDGGGVWAAGGDRHGWALAREIRGKLDEIEKRKVEKRKGKIERALERQRRSREMRDDGLEIENEHGKSGTCPAKSGNMSWVKRFFWSR